jgi:PAS domain S-box-containing protein
MDKERDAVLQENQQLKEQLAAYQTRFRSLIERNFDGILVLGRERGIVFYLNPAAEKILGRERDELVGNLFGYPVQSQDKVEIDVLRPDGSQLVAEMAVEETTWEGEPAYLASLRDITDRVEMEHELRSSEQRFRRAIQDAPYPIMIHDEDGQVLTINRVWEELTGYSLEEIPTISSWTEKAYGAQKELVQREIDQLYSKDRRADEGHYLVQTRSGEKRIWDFSSSPLGKNQAGKRTVVSMAKDVTNQVRAEEERDSTVVALKQRERAYEKLSRELEAILDHIPALVFYKDRENRFVRVNQYVADAHDTSKQALVGKHMSDIYPDAEQYWQDDLEVIHSGEPKLNVIEPWVTDDKQRWVSTSKIPFRNNRGEVIGVIGVSQDVTELKETQEELQRQVKVNQAAAEVSRALVGMASIEEISQLIMDKSREITGSTFGYVGFIREEDGALVCPTMTRDVWEVCQVEDKEIVFEEFGGLWGWTLETREPLLTNQPGEDPRSSGIPEGHIPIERFLTVPALLGGELVGQIALANPPGKYTPADLAFAERMADIYALAVQRARAQEKLAVYAEDLEAMVEERTGELEEAQEQLVRKERLAVLGQLAGGVGHELRNPLGVMANAVYFLKMIQPEADGKVAEYLAILEGEIETSEKIVSDLMDFARLKDPHRMSVDIAPLLDRVIEREKIPPEVQVVVHLNGALPPVHADPDHIVQILSNLVSNACQAMEAGGALDLQAYTEDDQVVIEVRDTGEGIPPENEDKIFQPLFTTRARGIGLGLALSEKLARGNRGRIEFESQPGSGSTFRLVIPRWQE